MYFQYRSFEDFPTGNTRIKWMKVSGGTSKTKDQTEKELELGISLFVNHKALLMDQLLDLSH